MRKERQQTRSVREWEEMDQVEWEEKDRERRTGSVVVATGTDASALIILSIYAPYGR